MNRCVRVNIVMEVRRLQERLYCFKNVYIASLQGFLLMEGTREGTKVFLFSKNSVNLLLHSH